MIFPVSRQQRLSGNSKLLFPDVYRHLLMECKPLILGAFFLPFMVGCYPAASFLTIVSRMQSRQLYIFIGGPLDGQALSIPTEQDTVDVQDENKAAKRIQYRKRLLDVNGKQFSVFAIADVSEQQIEKVKTRWQAYFQ